MRYEEVGKGVTNEEGLAYPCGFCGVPKGIMCVYTSDFAHREGGVRVQDHVRGDTCQVIHSDRRRRVHSARYDRYRASLFRNTRPVTPVSEAGRAIRAALLAYDTAEYNGLVGWWREHGEIIVNPLLDTDKRRPDGTARGSALLS